MSDEFTVTRKRNTQNDKEQVSASPTPCHCGLSPQPYRPLQTHVYLKASLGFDFTKMGHAILLGSPGVIQGPGRCGRCAGGSAGTHSPCEAGATQTPKLVCGGSCFLPSTWVPRAQPRVALSPPWELAVPLQGAHFRLFREQPSADGLFPPQNALQNTCTWTLQYWLF